MENNSQYVPPGFCVRITRRRGGVRQHPLAVAVVFLMLGIVTAWHSPGQNGWVTWGVPLLLTLVVAVLMRRKAVSQTLLTLFAVFLFGGWLCSMRVHSLALGLPGHTVNYEGVVASLPVAKGETDVYDVIVTRMELGGGMSDVPPFKVRMRIPHDWEGGTLNPGEGVVARSRLYPPSNDWLKGKATFDYRLWMMCKGYSASTRIYPGRLARTFVDATRLSVWDKTGIRCLRLRERLVDGVRSLGMSDDALAVVLAMSVGDKSGLSNDVRSVYSDAGVSHVLALSGLHLSIIYALFSFFLLPLGRGSVRHLAILMATWGYVFMVGMSPSVMRSALMFTVFSLLTLCSRTRMSVNVLAFAAFALLMVNPLMLFDVGFQLSFMAVLGIILFFYPLYRLFPRRLTDGNRLCKAVLGLGVTSFAAQLATAPIVAYCFHSLPVYFLLANYVVIPAVTLVLYLAAALFLTGFLPSVQVVIARVLDVFVSWLHRFLEWVSQLPCATVDNLNPSLTVVALCYLAELALLLFIKHRQSRRQATTRL